MITRVFLQSLHEMLAVFPVVALVGPRQVGKSTLVLDESIARSRRYTTLDSIPDRTLAESDPVGFLSDPAPTTIDEVQLVPDLLREIKRNVDRDRTPGRYLITGSADLNYASDLSHVLAGRVGLVELPPVTLFERYRAQNGSDCRPAWVSFLEQGPAALSAHAREPSSAPFSWHDLTVGGFPLSILAQSDRARELWLDSFRTTFLERDLRRLSEIGDLVGFSRLMQLSASRTAGVLNQAGLARDAGLKQQTVGRYLSLLEAGLLIRRVPGWFSNIGKRIVKSPKLYWRDAGVASFLSGIGAEAIEHHPLRGALFETMAIGELAALLPVYLHGARLFHLRTHDGLEVDAIVQHRNQLYPFEVKASRTVSAGDATAIERWIDLASSTTPTPAERGCVLYAGTTVQQLSRRVWAVPVV